MKGVLVMSGYLENKMSLKEQEVICKALLRASENLSLKGSELAKIIGVAESSISRLKKGEPLQDAKKLELALGFLRVYRSLDAVAGPEISNMKAWFDAENNHLLGVPRKLIQSTQGLFHVAEYLDAMRSKL